MTSKTAILFLVFAICIVDETMALHSKEGEDSVQPERWGALEDSAIIKDMPPEWSEPTATEYFLFTNDETRAYLRSFLGFQSYEMEPYQWKQKDFNVTGKLYNLRYVRYNFDFDE